MKRLRSKIDNRTLEMTVNERLSNDFQKKYEGVSSVSVKVKNRIGGLKLEHHAALVKSATDQALSEADGTISFRLPMDYARANTDRITAVVERIHNFCDIHLGNVYDLLPDDAKEKGKIIAIQNRARQKVLEKLSVSGITNEDVSYAMEALNILYVPDGQYLQSDLTMGTNMYVQPVNLNGFKEKKDEDIKGNPTVWRKTSSAYGRKRIPIHTDAADRVAISFIFDMADSWQKAMSGVNGGDPEQVLSTVEKWCLTLEVPKGYEVAENKLSLQDEKAAMVMADQIIEYIQGGK